MKKEWVFYAAIAATLSAYLSLVIFADIPNLYTIITTGTTLIAAVAFWLQLKRTKNLNEATFIMNLNSQFISNPRMTDVEHTLELYYNNARSGILDDSLLAALQDRSSQECQRIIDYLVYLESLASIIKKDVLHLGVIDDLFAYRFFIAVNNPVVQKYELLPYANFYQGCFWLSRKWTKLWRKQGRPIPLDAFSLSAIDQDFTLRGAQLEIGMASPEDDLSQIAECIYLSDRYIYPCAFGDDIEKAKAAIADILRMEQGLFQSSNIIVARMDNEVCGAALINTDGADWPTKAYLEVLKGKADEAGFRVASEDYFAHVSKRPQQNTVEIVAIAVREQHRRKCVATQLISHIIAAHISKSLSLDVLADNTPAISLYKNLGFEIADEHEGFGADKSALPHCYTMVRK